MTGKVGERVAPASCNCSCAAIRRARCSEANCTCSPWGVARTLSPLGFDCGCGCRPPTNLWSHASLSELHITIPTELEPAQAPAAGDYRLTFPVRNPDSAQVAAPVKVEVRGVVPVYVAPVTKPPASPTAAALQAPLAVVSSFLPANSSISQSSPNPGELNTLRIAFASRDTLRAQDHINITISGLVGAHAPASGVVAIGLSTGFRSLLRHTGIWRKEEGQLVVFVTGDIRAGDVTAFSFEITNPGQPQESPTASIESSGLIHLKQALGSSSDNRAPLLVGAFTTASITQSTPFIGATNLLSIAFRANVALPKGTSLVISGFTNTSLADSSPLPVTAASDASAQNAGRGINSAGEGGDGGAAGGGVGKRMLNDSWIESNATWDAREGRLVATLAHELVAHRDYWFRVSIQNPPVPREPIHAAHILTAGVVRLPSFNMSLGVGNSAPLFSTGWKLKSIQHSTIATSAINTLTISLQTPATLFANSSVSISGLRGSVTPSGRVPVEAADVWEPVADWDRGAGLVVLRLAANTIPDKVYTFAIALQNSALGQPSPWPIVLEARQGGAGGGAGQRLLPVEEMSVPGGILSPLVIAGFSNKTISQSTSACNASNHLTITLVSQVPLDARYHTIVTIFGLTSSGTGGVNRKLPLTSNPPVLGTYYRWFQERGAVVLNVAEDSAGLAPYQPLVIQLALRNPAAPRVISSSIRIQVTWRDEKGISVMIGSQHMAITASNASLAGLQNATACARNASAQAGGIADGNATLVCTCGFF